MGYIRATSRFTQSLPRDYLKAYIRLIHMQEGATWVYLRGYLG
jgi:hypothetical protein